MTDAIVSCRGLQRTYRSGTRETQAVRGVDLDVAPGEWVAIMGPSGCGKSSLLHLLGGLDTPDAGTASVAGEDLARLSETKRALLRRRASATCSSSSTSSRTSPSPRTSSCQCCSPG